MISVPPFVSPGWFAARRDSVVLVDVRSDNADRTAAQAYAAGHLPGAVDVDLERWLSGPPSADAGRHPLPTPEVFAEGMARAGIGDEDTVVAYDDAGGVVAARLVWMLRATGHAAALLDGAAPGTDTAPVTRPRGAFTVVPWPAEKLATLGDAVEPANVVLDARPRQRFDGEPDPLDPRPGHVPGARSLPCRENLGPDGTLLPVGVLQERLRAVGAGPGAPVVSYCGSGVTACHTLLVREHVGFGSGRLYPGSWSQYASDPSRPVGP